MSVAVEKNGPIMMIRQQLNLHLRELVRRRLDTDARPPVAELATPAVVPPTAEATAPLWAVASAVGALDMVGCH